MSLSATISEITKAAQGSRRLQITGYKNAQGDVLDYEVEILPENGYHGLVKASHDLVKSGKIPKPDGVDQLDWICAQGELLNSWERTLNGSQPERQTQNLERSPAGYWVDPGKPDTVVLRHLRRISSSVVSEVDKKPVKSASKTIAKQLLSKQCPLNEYIGQLNLGPGKFVSVKAL